MHFAFAGQDHRLYQNRDVKHRFVQYRFKASRVAVFV